MSEEKFTVGPWGISLSNGLKIWSKDKLIACVKMPQHCFSSHNSTADAHLIAAAPEMYRMLEDSIDALRASNACGEDFPDEVLLLLAKARGE